MKRPNIKDYLTSNQYTYHERLKEYYAQLEKYADNLEKQLKEQTNSFKINFDGYVTAQILVSNGTIEVEEALETGYYPLKSEDITIEKIS